MFVQKIKNNLLKKNILKGVKIYVYKELFQ